MENQELINEIGKILIDKKMYVDMKSISLVFSWLDKSTLGDIISDLKSIE